MTVEDKLTVMAGNRLVLDLKGRDPDEGMTSVAYEKGAALLYTIEQMVGRERFDPWLRGYFNRHAFTSISAGQFVQDLRQELLEGDDALRPARPRLCTVGAGSSSSTRL